MMGKIFDSEVIKFWKCGGGMRLNVVVVYVGEKKEIIIINISDILY